MFSGDKSATFPFNGLCHHLSQFFVTYSKSVSRIPCFFFTTRTWLDLRKDHILLLQSIAGDDVVLTNHEVEQTTNNGRKTDSNNKW